MQILLIEDNADLSATLWDYLESQGYLMDAAPDGVTGLHLATVNDYDAIVLDLNLPGIDGLELCRRLRHDAKKSTPVLMLTARDALEEKLHGFESGADDYLVKPFALEELEARLRVLVRRSAPNCDARVLHVDDLSLNLDTLEVMRAGQRITLTRTGLQILEQLMRRPGHVLTRRALETIIWGDSVPDSDVLRTHIHALRNAIDKPFPKPLLHTVHGIGYRLGKSDDIQR